MDLARFGFTPTEAKVYLALLPISPATGYAVALAAKLARANTYDALEGLAGRGAVTRLPGRPVRYAALDSDALVLRLRREYSSDLDSLADTLSRVRQVQSRAGLASVESLADPGIAVRTSDRLRAQRSLRAARGRRPVARETFADLEGGRGRVNRRVLSLGAPAPADAAVRESRRARSGPPGRPAGGARR